MRKNSFLPSPAKPQIQSAGILWTLHNSMTRPSEAKFPVQLHADGPTSPAPDASTESSSCQNDLCFLSSNTGRGCIGSFRLISQAAGDVLPWARYITTAATTCRSSLADAHQLFGWKQTFPAPSVPSIQEQEPSIAAAV